MKVTALPNDELVKFYIELRDRRAARKKTYVTEDDADKVKQEYIEGVLLQRYNAAGIESARTMYGTAFKSKLTTASSQVHYVTKPGRLMFFNSHMPHLYSVDNGYEPFRFIHWNIQAIPKPVLQNNDYKK